MQATKKLELLCALYGPHTQSADGSVKAVPDKNGEIWFGAEIWIDGSRMEATHSIDISELARSIQPRSKPYRCDIFTCGCGEAGCAAILDGIEIRHHGKFVFWSFREPLAGAYRQRDARRWLENSSLRRLRFRRLQLAKQLRKFFELVRASANSNLYQCYVSPHSDSLHQLSQWSAIREFLQK